MRIRRGLVRSFLTVIGDTLIEYLHFEEASQVILLRIAEQEIRRLVPRSSSWLRGG